MCIPQDQYALCTLYNIILLFVIAQGCGQTLGLGLGQSKDIVVVIISLQRRRDRHVTWKSCGIV